MNRKRLKRVAAMMMAVVLTVCAATPAGSFALHQVQMHRVIQRKRA